MVLKSGRTKGLTVSLPEVQGFIAHYMRSFPALFKWREKTVREAGNRDNIQLPASGVRCNDMIFISNQ
jgi:hypothetical protein